MIRMNKVVRSYGPASDRVNTDLEAAFKEGWQFERASEYIPSHGGSAGYIEYILYKEVIADQYEEI
jgi:hypothetical protein